MTEIEILKAQIASLEKLVQLKDQVISQLQSYPRYPYWVTNGQTQNQSLFQNAQNYQQNCNQQTLGLASISGGQSNG